MTLPAAIQVLSVVTTVGSEADARQLAAAVLEERLAACVQIDRLASHYRWQGTLCDEAEWRLTLKSTPEKLQALQAVLGERHPYDLPQVVWQLLDATPAYAAWVRGEVDAISAP